MRSSEPLSCCISPLRTPEQIRAGNLRLGLIMLAIVVVFFVSAIVKQVYFGAP